MRLPIVAECDTINIDHLKIIPKLITRRVRRGSREVIFQVSSERRTGEMDNIKNLPALLTKRLAARPSRLTISTCRTILIRCPS